MNLVHSMLLANFNPFTAYSVRNMKEGGVSGTPGTPFFFRFIYIPIYFISTSISKFSADYFSGNWIQIFSPDFQQSLSYSHSFYTSLCALMGKHVKVFYLSNWREVVRPLTVFVIQITTFSTCDLGFQYSVTCCSRRPLSSATRALFPSHHLLFR